MKILVWLVSLVPAMMLTSDLFAQDEPNALIGSQLYRSYCFVCHGPDGKSRGPVAEKLNYEPADLTSERYQTKDVKDLAAVIGGYRRMDGSDMPNWSVVLSEADLLDIAAYTSVITRGDLRTRGDTRRGRVIFKRACAACHGSSGTGRGLLAHVIGISMIDFTKTAAMQEMSDEELVDIIRDGKGVYMPSWQESITDNEIVDVASYVRLLAR